MLTLKETEASGDGCYTYWYRQVWPEATKRKAALEGAIALVLVAAGLCYAATTTIHNVGNGSGASMQCATHTRTGWIFDHNKTAITTFKLRRR